MPYPVGDIFEKEFLFFNNIYPLVFFLKMVDKMSGYVYINSKGRKKEKTKGDFRDIFVVFNITYRNVLKFL